MSYCFTLSFLPVENKEEALVKAEQFASALVTEKAAEERIRNNLIYFTRKIGHKDTAVLTNLESHLLEYWLHELFAVRCTYWPEHKLLAITGEDWPEVCEKMTAGSVLFQNSTDQDYDFSDWPSAIPFFSDRIERMKGMSNADVIAAGSSLIESETEECIEYVRRYMLYYNIFQELDLTRWMSIDEGKFQRFAMSGITNWYVQNNLRSKALSQYYSQFGKHQ